MSDMKPEVERDRLLRRRAAADALTEAGYPISMTTLATMASRGTGGPQFRLFGRTPLYRWGDVLDWAKTRTSPSARSVAECEAARKAAA